MTRKTTEQFIKEMKEVNPKIEIIGEYTTSQTKIKVRCLVDGYTWKATPNNLLQGKGCPKCAGNNKKTHDDFICDVRKIHPNLSIIGKYINNHTKIRCFCNIHNNYFDIHPTSLLNGIGCLFCSGYKKTNKDFLEQIKKINPNITILDEYIGCKTKIKVQCNIDGYIWETTPTILLLGHNCPQCVGKKKRNKDEFILDLNKINDSIEVIGDFINLQNRVKVKCNICNHEWNPIANSLLQGNKCPLCNLTNNRKTHEQFIKDLLLINKNILVLDKYLNSTTKIKVRCLLDGNEWYVKPANLLSGNGCPLCYINSITKENSRLWKGGITPLYPYFRGKIKEWKKLSSKFCSYKCIVTGCRFDEIHHIYPFSNILIEAFNNCNIKLYDSISEYTEEELEILELEVLNLHKQYGLGVCLRKDIHDIFHKEYGNTNNTQHQLLEFIKRIKDGEFYSIIGNIKINYDVTNYIERLDYYEN